MAMLVLLCFVLLSAEFSAQQEQARICHKAVSDFAHISVEQDNQQLPEADITSQVCNLGNHQACYTLWKEIKTAINTTEVVIIAQGCWESSGKEDCNSPVCVAYRRPPKAMNDTKFCCCSGDLCNNNVSVGYDDSRVEFSTATQIASSEKQTKAVSPLSLRDAILIIFSCVVTITIGLVGSVILYKSCHSPNKPQMLDSVRLVENIQNEQPLKMIELVGQGRYGSLWKGMNKDGQLVAVKMFPPHYQQLYCNERDIYSLPFMDNPAIVTYYGCQESSGQLQLILLYCNLGCLQDYLKANTVDSTTFCRMASSIAKGLAHLHTEIRHGDKYKPCVCHRDLNTRNILVKSDLSCCICDLGLALQLTDSRHCGGEEAAIKAISDVGTLRYMAPEVLEGAVNLRDCESSLKQIDVYALGLVLWELATRCSDFYISNASAVPYAMPFEAEIGQHPSFEQMLQVMVSRNKARPLFPHLWRDCPAVRLVRETIEDCWDQDAEARLTALCVEERLSDLTQLCQRGKSHGCYPYSLGAQIISFNNATSDNNTTTTDDTVESTVSEGTVETLLTMSPSEPAPTYTWKDSNSRANITANVAITIQPYQGRNPCLERNLLMWDSQEGDSSPLVDRSMKHQVVRGEPPPVVLQPAASNIPYVHNRVPKQSNVPPSTQLPGFIRKLLPHKKLNLPVSSAAEDRHLIPNGKTKDVKVTISPFEKHSSEESQPTASGGRPTSLPLELGSVFLDVQSGRIKRELSDRIKTPGDVPPSVRRKRARLSLYDDRIMDQSASSF